MLIRRCALPPNTEINMAAKKPSKQVNKALRLARGHFAVGGNPGDLASGGFGTGISGRAATPGDVASAVDRGNAMAAGRQGGGPGSAGGISNPASVTARANAMTSPASAAARLGPNAAQAMAGAGVSPDTAIRAAQSIARGLPASGSPADTMRAAPGYSSDPNVSAKNLNAQLAAARALAAPTATQQVLNYDQNVRAPDLMSVTPATKAPNPLLDPNKFQFSNYGVMSGMQPEVLDKLVAMQNMYGQPVAIGPHSGYRSPAMNELAGGAPQSQHLTGSAVDVTAVNPTTANTVAMINAAKSAGFTGLGAYNEPGLVHMDIGPARSWGPNYSGNSVSSLPNDVANALLSDAKVAANNIPTSAPGASINPNTSPAIGPVKAADYGQVAAGIQGYSPSTTNQLAFGTVSSTPTAASEMINSLKAVAANPNATAAQKAVAQKQLADLQALGGIAISPGSMLAPAPKGAVVDPATGRVISAPGYNVVAGPYAEMASPYGTFKNVSFAMPSDVAMNSIQPNPNFAQPTAPQGTSPVMANNHYVPEAVLAAREVLNRAPATTVANAAPQPAAARPVSAPVAPQTEQNFVDRLLAALKPGPFSGHAYDVGSARGEAVPNRFINNRLLSMGYTQQEIDAMSFEEREAALHPQQETTVAATGGRINYEGGGVTKPSKSAELPDQYLHLLPEMPAYVPTQMVTYANQTIPSASSAITAFAQSAPGGAMAPSPSMPVIVNNTQGMGTYAPAALGNLGSSNATNNETALTWMNYRDWLAKNPGQDRKDYWEWLKTNNLHRANGGSVNNSVENALRMLRR
jgi:hypothetical protein